MKYLWTMMIALATISTASASTQRGDCCGGGEVCYGGHC